MMMNKMQGRWLIVIAFSGSFIATRAADATPWRVRGNTDGRAKRLLSRLEADPRDDSGIQAFIALLGPRRALTLARQHAHGGSWAGSFIVGRLLLLAKQPKHALVAFRQALGRAAQSKGTAGLLGWIGEALVNAGEVPAAKRLLQRWRKKRPKDQGALRLSIRLALAARDTRRACTLQGELAHLRPKDAQIWTVYARLLKQTGELSQAASAYKTALKHLAQDPALRCQLLRELGHILETLERFDAAVGHYKEALKLSRRGSYVHRALSAIGCQDAR
ncbi:MAG: hypothetical protein KAI47_21685 [Deltaproteobacteria bacterium]|nr:hypothetical protein [Deltaproteobacteria bacterium]